mmetsp:Transcript_57278/g.153357  ORF Transcript_57278/g.153357 Transcript_57278/m.153357 type:complete len:222 (-) Transcript_57278:325-990(-)
MMAFQSGTSTWSKSTKYVSASQPTPVIMEIASSIRNCFLMWPTVWPPVLSFTSKSTSWHPQGHPQQHKAQLQGLWFISITGMPAESLMSKVIMQHAKGSTTDPICSPDCAFVTKTSGLWKQQHVHLNGRSIFRKGCGIWPLSDKRATSMLKGRWSPSNICRPSIPIMSSDFSAAINKSLPVEGSESIYLFGISNPIKTSANCTFSLIFTPFSVFNRSHGSE